MTIRLVTGGSGYLASRLVARLDGEVHALVRESSDTRAIDSLRHIRVWRSDGTPQDMKRIIGQIDPTEVFHLASCYRRTDNVADVPDLVEANVAYGTVLLQALTEVADPIFVYAGSFFENYRDGDFALNLYAATKRAFEEIVRYHADAYQLRSARVVMYEVYGTGDPRAKFMNAVVGASLTGSPLDLPHGDPKLDLVYVDDAADALIAAAAALADGVSPPPEGYSASSGELTPLSAVIDLVEAQGGRRIQTNVGAYPPTTRSIDRPWRSEPPPGWTPLTPLAVGVERMLREANNAF